ncbi:hypothetical protein Dimus_025201, partial [Dionaea muscipula]
DDEVVGDFVRSDFAPKGEHFSYAREYFNMHPEMSIFHMPWPLLCLLLCCPLCLAAMVGLLKIILLHTTLIPLLALGGYWNSHTTLIPMFLGQMYAKYGEDEVNKTKVRPNEITFVSSLQACSLMGAQELGESIQDYATKAGYLPNSFLVSALIDMYCKFGRIKHGKALFDQSPIRDLICWSSLINGCGYEALDTFSNMLNQ